MKDLQNKNYYERLGVARNATEQEIKDAYTSIAKVYHPDSHFFDDLLEDAQLPTGSEEDEVFKLVTEAYNTLINSEKRADYDRTLPAVKKKWNDQTDTAKEVEMAHREMRILKEKPKSWGTFGNVDDLVEVVVEKKGVKKSTSTVNSVSSIKSVAEMIQDQREKEKTENKTVVVVPKWVTMAGVAVVLVIIVAVALFFVRAGK